MTPITTAGGGVRTRMTVRETDGLVDGQNGRWSGQRERRRAEFVDAAIEAIGVAGPDVSVDKITERLGISRTKLYRHFDDAADLQRAVAQRATDMITEQLRPVWNPVGAPRQMIATAVSAYFGWITEHPNLYRYLERHSLARAPQGEDALRRIKTTVGGQLADVLAAYLTSFGVDVTPAENLAFGSLGLVETTTSRWLDHPGTVTAAELTGRLGDWVWLLFNDVLVRGGVVLDPDAVLEHPAALSNHADREAD
jgi:AcrR family transcriptional regulator